MALIADGAALRPLPNADHCVPSHLAMFVAATEPAWEKHPPAKSSLPLAASTVTGPSSAPPTSAHPAPSHLSINDADAACCQQKPWPTKSSWPMVARAATGATPGPSAAQFVPSHLAMLLTLMPPASEKDPPTNTSEPSVAIAVI